MADQRRQFEIVADEPEAPRVAQPHVQPPGAAAAIGMLGLALRALSQRALIAVADLFTLITVMSVFWLWWSIADPNEKQITALSIYALFILAANVIVRRKG